MSENTMMSAGIDIGTSTTQLVLSQLTFQNLGSSFSVPKIAITKKDVIYRSRIIFTPLVAFNKINDREIERFVASEYRHAGVTPHEIQMGAVIITGETARKQNAAHVVQSLSRYAGDFVVATAGPDLESIIAAKGAGAALFSSENHCPVINLDIGGGTTNIAVMDGNDVLDTACFDIGGRLIRIDPKTMTVTYMAPKIKILVQNLALPIKVGEKASAKALERVAGTLVRTLETSVGVSEKDAYFDLLITNHALTRVSPSEIKTLSFSGGVADCLTAEGDPFRYGDIGILLGRKLRQSQIFNARKVIHAQESIRATVVGAGAYTVSVSGSTITFSNGVLPIRNLPVVTLTKGKETWDREKLAEALRSKLAWYQANNELNNVAIALNGSDSPAFREVQACAQGIVQGAGDWIRKGEPLIVITRTDTAKALGHSLAYYLPEKYPFVCIDRVRVADGDYIDLGAPVARGTALPVIVKTLIFG